MNKGISKMENVDPHFHKAVGLPAAIATNMNAICGIGPFITIPAMLTAMGGPQAIFGWMIGALVAMADGLVWAELGASMPGAGGTYLYLREAYQYQTGKLMPFLFAWTSIISLPLILSTGVIGFVQYLGAFIPGLAPVVSKTIGVVLVLIIVAALYRKIESVKVITVVLWCVMMAAVLLTVIASFSHWDSNLAFSYPKDLLSSGKFAAGLGAGLVIALYDYTGYSTVAYMGAELKNPGRVMPRAIILSILFMGMLYLTMQIGVLGTAPWSELTKSDNVAAFVVSKSWGKVPALIVSGMIMIAAAASIFTGLLGASRVPYNAAKDGVFFSSFGNLHPKYSFPNISLLVMGAVVIVGSLLDLTAVINILTGVTVLIQSLAQIVALTILRHKQPGLERPYKQFLYPVPSIIAFFGWVYAFTAIGTTTMLFSIVWVIVGIGVFLVFSYFKKIWPFGDKEIHEEFLEKANK